MLTDRHIARTICPPGILLLNGHVACRENCLRHLPCKHVLKAVLYAEHNLPSGVAAQATSGGAPMSRIKQIAIYSMVAFTVAYPLSASAQNLLDWQAPGGGTMTSGTPLTMKNVSDKEMLKYGSRTFGINLVWDKKSELEQYNSGKTIRQWHCYVWRAGGPSSKRRRLLEVFKADRRDQPRLVEYPCL